MQIKLGIIMDPIHTIKPYKDSSLAMLLAAQKREWSLLYMEPRDLYVEGGEAGARMRPLQVFDSTEQWFSLGEQQTAALDSLDIILMRRDPPMDLEYLYITQLLDMARARGTLVLNHPQALRDANEKLFALQFPQCIPPTLVSSRAEQLKAFWQQHGDIILKPLDAMGGASIFRVKQEDPNINVIIETMTEHGRHLIMAQRYVPEISQGDRRILLIDGEPVPYALARIPAKGETRGNLAAGGRAEGVSLSERERWICGQVAPELRERGLLFVGLDVIGNYLTEINVTSPTCIRELDKLYGLDIAGDLMGCLEQKLRDRSLQKD